MFGLLYAIGLGIGAVISGTKETISEFKSMERGYERAKKGENIYNAYIDKNGATRDLATREFLNTERDYITGDLYVRLGAPSKRIRNLSKEWRDAFFEYEKENHTPDVTVVPDIQVIHYSSKKMASDCIGNPTYWINAFYAEGQWYKDLDTERLYVCRQIKGIDFYMDVLTGKLVRITDRQQKWYQSNPMYAKSEEEIFDIQFQFNLNREMEALNLITESDWREFYLNYYKASDDLQRLHEIQREMGEVCPRHPRY